MLKILSSKFIRNQILSSAKDSINQSSINQKDVNSFSIPLPPINLQDDFGRNLLAIENQKSQAIQNLQKAEDLFQSLLQKAFKGEL